jgi:hypothetical protein
MWAAPDRVALRAAGRAGAVAVTVAACAPVEMNRVARPSLVDVVDAVTTFKALENGGRESNPVVNALSDGTPLQTAAGSVLMKIATRALLTGLTGSEDCARAVTNTVSAIGAVNNALVLAGVAHPVSGAIGVAAAFAVYPVNSAGCPRQPPRSRQRMAPDPDDRG